MEFNDREDVTIDSVTADATLDRAYRHATIHAVSVRRHGRWVRLGDQARPLRLNAGQECSGGSPKRDVIAQMFLSGRARAKTPPVRKATGVVVDGGLGLRVRIVR